MYFSSEYIFIKVKLKSGFIHFPEHSGNHHHHRFGRVQPCNNRKHIGLGGDSGSAIEFGGFISFVYILIVSDSSVGEGHREDMTSD